MISQPSFAVLALRKLAQLYHLETGYSTYNSTRALRRLYISVSSNLSPLLSVLLSPFLPSSLRDTSLRLAEQRSSIMPPSETTGPCVVCGESTYNRCSDCAKYGTDWMYFCSIEHKKLASSVLSFSTSCSG